MNAETQSEIAFCQEISRLTLWFQNKDLEDKYRLYKLYERRTPVWFKWLLWSMVAAFILRRVQLLLTSYFSPEATTAQYSVEIFTIAALTFSFVTEILALHCPRIAKIRGLTMLLAWFFVTSYTSHIYYPVKVVMIPTYDFCNFQIFKRKSI